MSDSVNGMLDLNDKSLRRLSCFMHLGDKESTDKIANLANLYAKITKININ